MNSQLLFAATVVVSTLGGIVSTAALAGQDGQPTTRAEVRAAYAQAAANGTLRKNDHDFDRADFAPSASAKSRAEVVAELNRRSGARLIGSAGSRSYNPFGSELTRTSTLTRAEVKADVRQAIADGTLPRTDYDVALASTPRRAPVAADRPVLARSVEPAAAGIDG